MVDVLSLPLWSLSPKLFQDWFSRVIPRNEGTREVPPHNLFPPLCAAGAILKGTGSQESFPEMRALEKCLLTISSLLCVLQEPS